MKKACVNVGNNDINTKFIGSPRKIYTISINNLTQYKKLKV